MVHAAVVLVQWRTEIRLIPIPFRQGRNHLDVFLGLCALLHVIITAGFLAINSVGASAFWFALWVLIAAYGFICTTQPYEVA